MRKLVEFFVRHTLFGDLLTVAIIILGVIAAFQIRRDAFPSVNFDVVTISTLLPGASPSEVEKLVTNPLEQDLKEVDGVKRMSSASIEGRSGITIFLDPDQTTADQGKADIQDVVDRIDELPEDAEKPVVTEMKSKQSPIIEVSIAGDLPDLELREQAKVLEQEIEKVPGVARVEKRGYRDIEIRVECDFQKLSRFRLSLDDVVSALKRQNLSIPGGIVETKLEDRGARERIVRTVGDLLTTDDVAGTVIRANELGEPIRVRDVAQVTEGLAKATLLNRANGLPSISLTILKKERADAIDLVNDVKEKVGSLKGQLDERTQVSYINDFSYFVKRRLGILTSNLGVGLALVLFLLPFLIPFRFSILIALGEPFAFLGTLLLLHEFDKSINLISMIGLIIVSGILVDDSIVVTENAVRLIDKEKMDPKEAAVTGTLQIMGPVAASVATTATAFLPMAFMSGIFGKFIREVPIAVITALVVSLFETFFILPGHIAHWIKRKDAVATGIPNRGFFGRVSTSTRGFWDDRVVPKYIKLVDFVVSKRYVTLGFFLALFVGTLILAKTGMKFILFPPEGIEIFFVRTTVATGTSLERHSMLLKPIEDAVATLPKEELENFTANVGIQQQDPHDPHTRRGAEYGQIKVFLTPETKRKRSAAEIIEDIRVKVGSPPGFEKIVFNRLNPGPPVDKPISIGIRAAEYSDILPAVEALKDLLAGLPGVTDIADSYAPGKEELRVKVNGAEAAAAGLSVASIGNTVRAAYEGLIATKIRTLDEEIDVRVSPPTSERSDARSLENLLIPNGLNGRGNLIPLSRVATIEKKPGLAVFEHEANRRQVKVTAEVDTKIISPVEANDKVRALLPEFEKRFPATTVKIGGEDQDTKESMASLARAFGFSILGIFLILVLTFKSISQPLVVLITVPLGIIAVIWAFFIHGMPITFLASLGIIALSGVIVNNAIVFIDFVNQRRNEGMDRFESIREAARTRIRPIFLTTVTTVIGILPTAYGLGGLDKFVVPIAMALGWGLLFGSVLTAFIFPAALAVLDDFTSKLERVVHKRKSQPVSI